MIVRWPTRKAKQNGKAKQNSSVQRQEVHEEPIVPQYVQHVAAPPQPQANMATNYQIPPPPHMSLKGDVAENFKLFKQGFESYVTATGLGNNLKNNDGTPNVAKVKIVAATLKSIMGLPCLRVLNTLGLTNDEMDNYETILSKLEGHFLPQRNILVERAIFNKAVQGENETIDQFITRLRHLARSCDFRTMEESILRDRLVEGTSDSAAQKRLMRERDPDLDKCINDLRASELLKAKPEQVHGLRKSAQPNFPNNRKSNKAKNHGQSPSDNSQMLSNCLYCGKSHLRRRALCFAVGKQCRKCNGYDHFAIKCESLKQRSKDANLYQQDSSESEGESDYECF